MFEKLESCPICRYPEFKNYIICKDHMVTGESFAITRCEQCGFLFTNPRPTNDILTKYYASDKYISHNNKMKSPVDIAYNIIRKYTLNKKLNLINSLSVKKKLLDFGCGSGAFLKTCQKNGWKIDGVEMVKSARKNAETTLDSPLYSTALEIPKNNTYRVITLWHVLEHVYDLNNTFHKLVKLLDKKGKIVIAVPNIESLDAALYHEFWAAYDIPRHLYHFSQSTMKLFLNNYKLKLKEIIPMPFDAYYVSMLSEKYQFDKTNYIKSILNGYKSNSYAKLHNNNYSSLIYIAGK